MIDLPESDLTQTSDNILACSLQMGSLAVQMSPSRQELSIAVPRTALFAFLRGIVNIVNTNIPMHRSRSIPRLSV
jgi:hypothetical protein